MFDRVGQDVSGVVGLFGGTCWHDCYDCLSVLRPTSDVDDDPVLTGWPYIRKSPTRFSLLIPNFEGMATGDVQVQEFGFPPRPRKTPAQELPGRQHEQLDGAAGRRRRRATVELRQQQPLQPG